MKRSLLRTAVVVMALAATHPVGAQLGGFVVPSPSVHVADLSAEIRKLRKPHEPSRPKVKHDEPEVVGTSSVRLSKTETKIVASLGETGTFEFNDAPLDEVIEWFPSQLDIPIVIDQRRLADEGIEASAEAITFSARAMSYGAALHHLLRPLNLTTAFKNDTLVVTTRDHAEEVLRTQVYPVWDLVKTFDGGEWDADYDTLIELITSTVQPNSWDAVGGPGSLQAYKGLLTVSNTSRIHQEVADLLVALRKFPVLSGHVPQTVTSVVAGASKLEPVAQELLSKRVHFSFVDTPLSEVVEWLREQSQLSILIDQTGLDDEGIDARTEAINVELKNVTVGTGLEVILADLHLSYVFDHEAIVITSRGQAEETLRTRVYGCTGLIDVADVTDSSLLRVELEQLRDLIHETIQTSSWDEYGGPATIGIYPTRGALVVSHTDDAHKRVRTLLQALQRGRNEPLAAPRAALVTAATPTVKSYVLSEAFADESAQRKLISLLEEMLRGSDNAVNDSDTDFRIQAVPRRLVISHRRDAQEGIERVLKKMGALFVEPSGDGGMF